MAENENSGDYTEVAEALSLLASLIAAGLSLWEQQKAEPKEDAAVEPAAKAQDFARIVWVLAGVVFIQFLLLLFLVYKIA